MVRRCTESPEEKCQDEKRCNICDSKLCNGEVFPTDRLKCLQCNSANAGDECHLADEKFLEPCKTYNERDQCFTYADETSLLHRGCDSDNNVGCNDDNCLKCSGESCNIIGLEIPNSLKCVICDSSSDNGCESGDVTVASAACSGTHNLNERETCYVHNVTSTDNKITTKRGCYFNLAEAERTACDKSESCHVCGVDSCNKIDNFSENRGFKCYVCSSETNKDCEKESVPGIIAEICSITPNSFNEGAGCFVERNNKVVVRDCKTSALSRNTSLESCSIDVEEKGNNCIVCDGDSCNKMGAPGSAPSVKIYSRLIVLSAMALVKYL